MTRLAEPAHDRHWDFVVGLTELPLHDGDERHLSVDADPQQRTAVLSLLALRGAQGSHLPASCGVANARGGVRRRQASAVLHGQRTSAVEGPGRCVIQWGSPRAWWVHGTTAARYPVLNVADVEPESFRRRVLA